jgi:NAD(P)-dependent dehydrogenase (short-subunit alcohol dehydrogenase family)
MKDGGSIILTGSIADIKGFPGMSMYSATKAAVGSFAPTWTNDLRDRRIRVNVLSPGYIDTRILEGLLQDEALLKMKKKMDKNVPLGRLGDSDEIARLSHSSPPMTPTRSISSRQHLKRTINGKSSITFR